MKVKHLVELLQEADPEMDVHIYADHGQWVQRAHFAGVEYHVEGHDGYLSEEDVEEYKDFAEKIFLIS